MYIQPNMLLTPTEKLIKPYECSFIVIEGPNMKGKLSLEGLEIKYDSFYVSQLTINANSKDQPLIYGFLGENVTFLMVRAKYLPVDPNWAVETEQFLQYYYKDDPGQIRTMGQLLVLTGNSTNRIPQIYFTNTSTKYKVYLEVMMANLPQAELTNTIQYAQNSSFSGLYWNSIVSDVINYIMPTSTGSTELHILDINSNTVAVIPYNNIRTIDKISTTILLIGLDTEEKVKLEFLTEFNCDQANSRINWVLKSTRSRILTKTVPTFDSVGPTLVWNDILTGTTTGITSGTTTLYLIPTGQTYTSTFLKEVFLSGITDNRDGDISIYDATVEMYGLGDIVPVTGITNVGIYSVIFAIRDLANNLTTEQKYISIYTLSIGVYSTGFWNDGGVWVDLIVWTD